MSKPQQQRTRNNRDSQKGKRRLRTFIQKWMNCLQILDRCSKMPQKSFKKIVPKYG